MSFTEGQSSPSQHPDTTEDTNHQTFQMQTPGTHRNLSPNQSPLTPRFTYTNANKCKSNVLLLLKITLVPKKDSYSPPEHRQSLISKMWLWQFQGLDCKFELCNWCGQPGKSAAFALSLHSSFLDTHTVTTGIVTHWKKTDFCLLITFKKSSKMQNNNSKWLKRTKKRS